MSATETELNACSDCEVHADDVTFGQDGRLRCNACEAIERVTS